VAQDPWNTPVFLNSASDMTKMALTPNGSATPEALIV
jgi:hypothetical protein